VFNAVFQLLSWHEQMLY